MPLPFTVIFLACRALRHTHTYTHALLYRRIELSISIVYILLFPLSFPFFSSSSSYRAHRHSFFMRLIINQFRLKRQNRVSWQTSPSSLPAAARPRGGAFIKKSTRLFSHFRFNRPHAPLVSLKECATEDLSSLTKLLLSYFFLFYAIYTNELIIYFVSRSYSSMSTLLINRCFVRVKFIMLLHAMIVFFFYRQKKITVDVKLVIIYTKQPFQMEGSI